jgi:HPt (histidine-containing phosphotransfer) domain-containing protein
MYLANGFNGFISKPVSTGGLNEILEAWLPQDKIKLKPKSKTEADSRKTSILDVLDGIDEIDGEIALSHFAGKEKIYYKTLHYFIEYLLPQCDKMSDSLDSGEIGDFGGAAHVIKSMFSTIGAMKLSEAALALEMASQGGDAEYCKSNFPQFLERAIALRTRLSEVLQSGENLQTEE